MTAEEIEQLQDQIKQLREQTNNLETQVYTLKAAVKGACELNEGFGERMTLPELVVLLRDWSRFELPDLETGTNGDETLSP